MITLLTGSPGAGKTAALVEILAGLDGSRPVFVDGLDGLKLPHNVCDANNWPSELPDGAILVVDEAQRVWRPRGPSAKVPDSVAEMETHRHRGIDIYMTTQSPRLVDANVRALVGRHIHIRDTGWYGRWWYEWPETNESLAWKSCPNKRRYQLPKKVFDDYTSASMHVKPVRGIPRLLWVILALLAVGGFLGWRTYTIIRDRNAAPLKDGVVPGVPTGGRPPVIVSSSSVKALPLVVDERVDFAPRITSRPWTAPAYDGLRQVVAVPYIAGALCVNDDCRCYGPDQRRLMDVASKECGEWLENRPFNPYVGGTASGGTPSRASPGAASAASAGGRVADPAVPGGLLGLAG